MHTCEGDAQRTQVSLWALFKLFLRIGATGFGGPAALLALLQEHVVERRKWLNADEFTDALAIGQILPGPIVVDAVTHIGYRLRGIIGAIASTSALLLPAFIVMLILTPMYFHFGQVPQITGAFKGIGGAVVGLIIAAGYRIGARVVNDAVAGIIVIVAFIALAMLRLDAIVLLLIAGAIGFIAYRQRRSEVEAK